MSQTPQALEGIWRSCSIRFCASPLFILSGVMSGLAIIAALLLFLMGAVFTNHSSEKWELYSGGCLLLVVCLVPLSYALYRLAKVKLSSRTICTDSLRLNGAQLRHRPCNGTRNQDGNLEGTAGVVALGNGRTEPQERMRDQRASGLDFPTSANIDLPPSYESVICVREPNFGVTHDAVPRSVSPALPSTAAASESARQTVVRFLGSCSTSENASTTRTTAPEVLSPEPISVDGPPPPYSPQTMVMFLGSCNTNESASTTSTTAPEVLSLDPRSVDGPPPPYSPYNGCVLGVLQHQ